VLDLFVEAYQRELLSEAERDEHARLARRAIGAATGLIRYLERQAGSD
jgi:hypothetical protein